MARRKRWNAGQRVSYWREEPRLVRTAVYDIEGRRVATLLDGWRAAGPVDLTWSGRADDGRTVPGGVYFVRTESGRAAQQQRLVVIR